MFDCFFCELTNQKLQIVKGMVIDCKRIWKIRKKRLLARQINLYIKELSDINWISYKVACPFRISHGMN